MVANAILKFRCHLGDTDTPVKSNKNGKRFRVYKPIYGSVQLLSVTKNFKYKIQFNFEKN